MRRRIPEGGEGRAALVVLGKEVQLTASHIIITPYSQYKVHAGVF
jgi:hypothetical protein